MSSGIMELSNALIYGNRLCCGSLEIANAKLKFSGRESVQLKLREVILFSLLNLKNFIAHQGYA
jgi:DNA replication ATP-dependent helicase Dna2